MELLDYTDDQLRALSDDELLALHTKATDKAFECHINQLTKKILINSLYGATANPYFPLYNVDYASAITCNGRYFIQKAANYIEDKLQEILPWDQKYIIYGDTDSVVGNTNISTDKGLMKIADIYDSFDNEIEYRREKFIKRVDGIGALSYNASTNTLEYKDVRYVMKHRVRKRMFKIKCNGSEIIVTGDHSIMVKRGDKVIDVKPSEVKKTDKIILSRV